MAWLVVTLSWPVFASFFFLLKTAYSNWVPSTAGAVTTIVAGNSCIYQQSEYSEPTLITLRPGSSTGGDRFIPRRRGVNLDVSRYRHVHEEDTEKDSDYLDIEVEIRNATEHWRKRHMDFAFRLYNIIDGLENNHVLNMCEPKMTNMELREVYASAEWKCRPRKYPLMNMKGETSRRYRDHGAQIFRFATHLRYHNIIDWSSQNILAAGLKNSLCICDVDVKKLASVQRVNYSDNICSLKWDSTGDRIALCGVDGSISLYSLVTSKFIWRRKCPCFGIFLKARTVIVLWAKKDDQIVSGCSNGCFNIFRSSTSKIIANVNFDKEVLMISISPNEQYVAVSTTDQLVRLFDYPSLVQLFEIAFYASVVAMAWHPWSSGVLCIGGGPGDGSLSVWNVNSQRQIGYRKVKFTSSVEQLMFNKLSGELLVHWLYLHDDRLSSKIAILANLDRVVDAVPVQPEHRMINIVWSPDHTKLAVQHRDILVVWNFFGSECQAWTTVKKKLIAKESCDHLRNYIIPSNTGPEIGQKTAKLGKCLSYFTIR